MKVAATLSAALLAVSTATAAAVSDKRDLLGLGGSNGGPGQWACGLSQDNIDDLINGYTLLLTSPGSATFNATAARILASNFTVYSDSINSLASRPLGQPSFPPGRDGFVASQFSTPPIPVLTTTDVYVGGYWNGTASNPSGGVRGGNSWYGGNQGQLCSDLKVSWRWTASGIGSNTYPVNGIVDFVLVPGNTGLGQDKLVVETVFAEFNTAAWLLDLGVQCVAPAVAQGSA